MDPMLRGTASTKTKIDKNCADLALLAVQRSTRDKGMLAYEHYVCTGHDGDLEVGDDDAQTMDLLMCNRGYTYRSELMFPPRYYVLYGLISFVRHALF